MFRVSKCGRVQGGGPRRAGTSGVAQRRAPIFAVVFDAVDVGVEDDGSGERTVGGAGGMGRGARHGSPGAADPEANADAARQMFRGQLRHFPDGEFAQ